MNEITINIIQWLGNNWLPLLMAVTITMVVTAMAIVSLDGDV